MIYTSGSTGRPKGTVNTHGGIVNRLLWMQEQYGLTAEDRVLQKTPLSFDVSVWELFWPLIAGARLVVARPGGHQDPGYLARTIVAAAVTTIHFVPPMLRVFLEAPGVERCRSLRRVVCSGEALPRDLALRFQQRLGAGLYNLYGPTEAAVDVTHWTCGEERGAAVPIGRPVANTWIRLLDGGSRPVPVGVPGELHIGGVQLARGYLARPDLTAEKFVPDPFAAEPGSRLYRTADLARYLPDGSIDFLGRLDHQVKVRGFRIELGEIEAALLSHPAVREAVVLARPGSETHGADLVAYVTARQDRETPSLAELREALGRSLPEHMLPAALVALEAMPLTPNGKLDRQALARIGPRDAIAPAGERVAPRTGLERFLAGLWRELLHATREPEPGVHDNFFELGGNSISGAILVNRLQQALGEIVHVVTIFDRPTIAGLASFLSAEYPRAVARLSGEGVRIEAAEPGGVRQVDETVLREVDRRLRKLPPLSAALVARPKNPPAVFILSPPRSGSTLLRVMLGGHPRLFAPPELELLSCDTMAERREVFAGRDAFRMEGLVRAVMEARHCGPQEALELVADCEREGLTTREMYGRLQGWIGERGLVDKTPTYAFDPEALRRAELGFDTPRYLHLVRHPLGTVLSFEEARIDQIFFQAEHPFTRRELAEALWVLAQRNTLRFLEDVPAERQHRVIFEDLVHEPEATLRGICAFLGLDYHPATAVPYAGKASRMTDGLYAESRMLGDVKFHQHAQVEAGVAGRWRQAYGEESLGEPARELAARLGYEPAVESWTFIPRSALAPGAPAPLSSAQERLWFLDQLEPGEATYNIPAAVRIQGPLRPAVLAAGLNEIVRRQGSLRTTFGTVERRPVQRIAPELRLDLPVIDLAALPPASRLTVALELAATAARRPFDLAAGPLLLANLLRLEDGDHIVLLTLHHIVSDGWSMGVLIRELAVLYGALASGGSSPLPELPLQYADYAGWQRSWLKSDRLAGQIDYWRGLLAGLPTLQLPTDRPRPPVQTYRGATRRLSLPAGLRDELERLARREGASLFMVLAAAFAVLLARITGQRNLAIGTPVANRNRREVEDLIGFFVNTLVIRTALQEETTLRELLAGVREVVLGALANQDVPFERLVEEMQPRRDLSYSPLFQALFALQNPSPDTLTLPGLELEILDQDTGTAKYDLSVLMAERAGGLLASFEYATDLFDAVSVERMAGHFRALLAGAAALPDQPVSLLPLLTPGETQQLLVEWNDTAAPVEADLCAHELFEAQVRRAPERTAIGCGGEVLSYGELEARANRLAHHLRSLGAGPEALVGLCVERSPAMVVAMLGILKAGGAYVPLDPATLPSGRR